MQIIIRGIKMPVIHSCAAQTYVETHMRFLQERLLHGQNSSLERQERLHLQRPWFCPLAVAQSNSNSTQLVRTDTSKWILRNSEVFRGGKKMKNFTNKTIKPITQQMLEQKRTIKNKGIWNEKINQKRKA